MKQTSIFSYVKGNSKNSESVDVIKQCCSNIREAPPPKRTKCDKIVKVRKWDETYLKFFLLDGQILNVIPQPECLICS